MSKIARRVRRCADAGVDDANALAFWAPFFVLLCVVCVCLCVCVPASHLLWMVGSEPVLFLGLPLGTSHHSHSTHSSHTFTQLRPFVQNLQGDTREASRTLTKRVPYTHTLPHTAPFVQNLRAHTSSFTGVGP